jgi:hypothetical protein
VAVLAGVVERQPKGVNFFPRGTSICVGFPVGPGETTILGGKFA